MTVTIFPKIQVPFFPVNMVFSWNIGVSPNSSYPSNILPFATEPWFGRKTVNCQSSWWFLITHSSHKSLVHWGRLFQIGVKVRKIHWEQNRRVMLSLAATISNAVKMTKPRYWTKTTPWDSIAQSLRVTKQMKQGSVYHQPKQFTTVLRKTSIAGWNMDTLKMYFLLKMGDILLLC